MLEITEVMDLVTEKVQGLKKLYSAQLNGVKRKDSEKIDFHPTYTLGVSYAERVRIHAEIGGFPAELFLKRAPNLTDKEYTYIEGNYKQNTLPVYMDYNSTVNRAFNDGGWSITYNGDADSFVNNGETLQLYIETKIKKYGSIENFVKYTVSHLKAIDANGIIAIKPSDIYFSNEVDNEGVPVIDTTRLFEPQPYYYRSDQVLARSIDEYYLVLLDERTWVEYGNTKKKCGFAFEFYDTQNIYSIKQVGKYLDFQFEISVYFNHAWNRVPCIELKGVPQVVSNEVVWQSPFLYACDNLDLALMNAQYLQVSIANSCFPYRVMVGSQCDYTEVGDDGVQLACYNGSVQGGITKKQCPSCHGSGLKDRVSPMGVLLLSKEDWSGSGDKAFADRAMYYVSPDVSALEFVSEKIDKDIDVSRKILHLHTSNSNVKGSDDMTATGMGIDLKAMYAFIKPISDQMFDVFMFCIDAIGWMRYGEAYKAPTLAYPVTFDYNTESDYMTQISEAQKAGLPPFVIHSNIYKYLNTLYYNEKKTAEVFTLIVHSDRLLSLSQDDINLKLTRGLVEKWEAVLHDSAITFVSELETEDPKFFEKDFADQKAALIEKAKSVTIGIKSTTGALSDTLINEATGGGQF